MSYILYIGLREYVSYKEDHNCSMFKGKHVLVCTKTERKVAHLDISGSEHVLWTYTTPSRTNWAPYLSRAGQIRLFLSFIKSYKIQTLTFLSADYRSQLSLFVCLAFVTKKYIPLFSLYDFITFNIAKTFTLCSQDSTLKGIRISSLNL